MPTLEREIAVPADCGYWREGDSSFDQTGGQAPCGYWNGIYGRTNSFFRFPNITIPQGATISAAYIQLRSNSNYPQVVVNTILYGVDEDDAASPSSYADAENGPRTTAYTEWHAMSAWSSGVDYQSPDITAVIQEIVDRGGWASGQALIVYWEDDGSDAELAHYRISGSYYATPRPFIHIEYGIEESVSDSGSGTGAIVVDKELVVGDSGVGEGDIREILDIEDSGTGSGSLQMSYLFQMGDAGAGAGALLADKDLVVDDTGGLQSETLEVSKDKPVADSGAGSSAVLVSKDLVLGDSGTGAGAILVDKDIVQEDSGEEVPGPVIQRGDWTEVRNHPQTAKLYMAIEIPRAVWTGTVLNNRGYNQSGDLENDLLINITGGANEAGFDVDNFLPDLTAYVGSVLGDKSHGTCRVRSFSGNNLVVGADMTCVWKVGDVVTIYDTHALWPLPHIVTEGETEVTVLKDSDLDAATYKDEYPIPIMGPPACVFLEAGTVDVHFHGSSSYLVQPNSDYVYWTAQNGISSYAWWFEGGSPSTSAAADVDVTYTVPGRYVARLEVTGENGKTYKGFRNVFVFNRTTDQPFTQFQLNNLHGSMESKGWEAQVTLMEGGYDPDELPNAAQVVLFAEEEFDGTAPTAHLGNLAIHNRENIKMVGWANDMNMTYREGRARGASMAIRGLAHYLQTKTNFSVYLTQVNEFAPDWSDYSSEGLTTRKVLYHLVRWHWTLMRFTDYMIPDDHNNYVPGRGFTEGSLAHQLDEICPRIQARWCVDKGGALHVFSWPNWLPVDGDGAGWRTRLYLDILLTEDDFSSVQAEPRVLDEVSRVRVEGVMANGAGWYAYSTDMAPGNLRNWGGATITISNQVLGTGGFEGSQGYELAQMVYAENSRRWESAVFNMVGNYTMFDVVPGTNYFKATVVPSSVLRDLSWTEKPFWVSEMEVEYDHEGGVLTTVLTGLPETRPRTDIEIYSQFDEINIDELKKWAQGGGFTLDTLLKDIDAPDGVVVPALMGDGVVQTDGEEPGMSMVRLFGDVKYLMQATNRLLHDHQDRPVNVLISKPDSKTGRPEVQIVGARQANDDAADTDTDRVFVQHFACFCVPGTASITGVGEKGCAPSFLVRRLKFTIKSAAAYAQTAPTGSALSFSVLKNGVEISAFSIAAAANDSGIIPITDNEIVDGDRLDVKITAVGSTTPGSGITAQIECWKYGV